MVDNYIRWFNLHRAKKAIRNGEEWSAVQSFLGGAAAPPHLAGKWNDPVARFLRAAAHRPGTTAASERARRLLTHYAFPDSFVRKGICRTVTCMGKSNAIACLRAHCTASLLTS